MNIADLKPKDKGCWVIYRDRSGAMERGRLKSWNGHFVFVVFKCDSNWHRFEDYTGQSCDPATIDFV